MITILSPQNPSCYLDSTTVCLDVNNVSWFHFLLLKTFIDRRVQLQLFCTLCRLQANNNMCYCLAISCQTSSFLLTVLAFLWGLILCYMYETNFFHAKIKLVTVKNF